jgi:hypothetical protein
VAHGAREYRVHVINGKVVPYATVHRGSPSGYVGSLLRPWASAEQRAAESYAQQAASRQPAQFGKQVFGYDVGIDTAGKPFLIEMNPSFQGSGSGFMRNIPIADAIGSAMRGRLPNYVKARNLAYGGLGTTGVYEADQAMHGRNA